MLKKWTPLVGGSPDQVKWDCLYNRRFDNAKIRRYIETSNFKATIPTLSDCLSSFLMKPQFKPINWEMEARKDKLIGERTSLSLIPHTTSKIKYLLVRYGLKK